MSRIHEALKKAEQVRAINQGESGEASATSAPIQTLPFSTSATDPGAVATEIPSFGSPFSLEALLAKCPQREWIPDLDTMLFMNGNDDARGTEEYRTLRSRLYHIREKMQLKVLLVTSALPKEGKSFTAANLAQVMVRQHGRRVLLIDADLRGPRLHEMLGASRGPGLSEYLMGKDDEFSVIQRGPVENLFFVSGGAAIEDPAELVGNGKLRTLLQRVEPLFDWVIIDSPPAVPVSDASVIAKSCDGVLMVVRSASTPSDAAKKARAEFPDQALVGVVLNGISEDAPSYERYYYEAYEKKKSDA
jgi:capsular exopolysaccharide synthesis family protein